MIQKIITLGAKIMTSYIPDDIVQELNDYVDETIKNEELTKSLDHGKRLAGDITQEIELPNSFLEKLIDPPDRKSIPPGSPSMNSRVVLGGERHNIKRLGITFHASTSRGGPGNTIHLFVTKKAPTVFYMFHPWAFEFDSCSRFGHLRSF